MRQNTLVVLAEGGLRLLATITLAAAALTGQPASAQTPSTTSQAATTNLVTNADLMAMGTQLGQWIDAQADQFTAPRQQRLAMKAQLGVLDRQVNVMKVSATPPDPRARPVRGEKPRAQREFFVR